MSRRSITSEWSFIAALLLIAACGGDGDDEAGRAAPDLTQRDRDALDTDRAQNQADTPARAADPGHDGDRPASQADRPPVPAQPEPPPAAGGRPGAGGADGGPGGGRGPQAGNPGRGGSGPPSPPPSEECTPENSCDCGDDLCAICECAYGPDHPTCEGTCS